MTKLLTADEMAKLLRIPKRTVYKFAQEGCIPGGFRLGKHWRFKADIVEKWIIEKTGSIFRNSAAAKN